MALKSDCVGFDLYGENGSSMLLEMVIMVTVNVWYLADHITVDEMLQNFPLEKLTPSLLFNGK